MVKEDSATLNSCVGLTILPILSEQMEFRYTGLV
jgi:hypothetical protein